MSLARRCIAGSFGTSWLVFGGCGNAGLSAASPDVGIGLLGVTLAFGSTVLTVAYAIGHTSGGHLNPGVRIGPAAFVGAALAGGIYPLVAGRED